MTKKKVQQRRANGEGSVYQLKDGRFGAAVSLGMDENSKRIRKITTGKSEAEVIEKMQKALKSMGAVEDAPIVIDGTTLVEDFVHEFKIKFLVRSSYIRACNSSKGYLTINPFHDSDLKKPKSKKKTEEIVSISDNDLLNVCNVLKESPIIYPVFKLMLSTGMRTQEALGLCWKDLDISTGQIHVCNAITIEVEYDEDGNKLKRSTKLDDTKTNGSSRIVMIDEDSVKILTDWKAVAPSVSKTCFGSDDFVFGNSRSNHWTYSGFRSSVNGHLSVRMGGVDSLRLHRIRHTVATILAEDGIGLIELMRQMGHTQAKTTMKYIDRVSKTIAEGNRDRLQQGLRKRLNVG